MVEASKDFVCIRLATYEDAEEAKFLENIFTGRSGQLENTVFVFLEPGGNRRLTRAGRGPQMLFRSPQEMAREMKKMAQRFPLRESDQVPRLPQMKNFRLALNVAECDARPLVVCLSQDTDQLKGLQDKLSPLTFNEDLCGRFNYASVSDPQDLSEISGELPEDGYLVIAPGEFGTDGALQKAFSSDVSAEELAAGLAGFADQFNRRQKEHRSHVRKGQQNDVEWQTAIPVTDPMSNAARDRASGKSKGKRGGRRSKRKGSDR